MKFTQGNGQINRQCSRIDPSVLIQRICLLEDPLEHDLAGVLFLASRDRVDVVVKASEFS